MIIRSIPATIGLTLLLTTVLSTCAHAQTVVLQQDFEGAATDNLPFTPSPATYNVPASNDVWATVAGLGSLAPATGTMFWGARDLTNGNGGNASTSTESVLSFDGGSACSLTGAAFSFDYNVFGFDGGDDFGYRLFVDNLEVDGGLLIDGANGGGTSSAGWVTETVSIPANADQIRLELWFTQNGDDDFAGIDNVRLTATTTTGSCTAVCGVEIDPLDISYLCAALTAGADATTAVIPYEGIESGVSVSSTVGSVGGDNPASVVDGEIRISGIDEGQTATLTVSGGDCNLTVSLQPPAGQCAPGAIIVNEFQFAVTNDEFIEVINASLSTVDVTGYTVEDRTGNRVTFPPISLPPGSAIVFANTPGAVTGGCVVESITPLGLNDGGDDIILRDASGAIIDQVTYVGNEVGAGESLARTPNGDQSGTFQPHSTVAADNSLRSPCQNNENPAVALPVTLTALSATAVGKQVRIDWQTAAERGNAYFIVERRAASASWVAVGRVEAGRPGGDRYELTDPTPPAGVNHYRLRQVDRDGTITFSRAVSATVEGTEVLIFPNPATTELYLAQDLAAARLSLMDATGRVLRRLPAGTDRVTVAGLTGGFYYLRAELDGRVEVLRFVKR